MKFFRYDLPDLSTDEERLKWVRAFRPSFVGAVHSFLYKVRYAFIARKPRLIMGLIKRLVLSLLGRKGMLRGADVAVGYECNLSCAHCNVTTMIQKDNHRMTFDEYRDAFLQLRQMGAISYTFTGGEPTLYDELPEIIRAFDPKGSLIFVQTNGMLLTDEKLKELADAGVDILYTSADSLHDGQVGEGVDFEAKESLIKRARWFGLNILFVTVVTPENLRSEELEEIIRFMRERKIMLIMNVPIPLGEWSGNKDMMLSPDDQVYLRYLTETHPNVRLDLESNFFSYGCPAFKERLYLSPYGDVLGCTFLQIGFGNLRDMPVSAIRDKGMSTPPFNRYLPQCPAGEDSDFYNRYLPLAAGRKRMPIEYGEIFDEAEVGAAESVET